MYRDVNLLHILKNVYLLGVLFYITMIYSSILTFFVIDPPFHDFDLLVYILFVPLQASFILLLWSMVRSVISDPGKVPTYFGTLMDDSETKKRRYCLICHIFKPDRCHHCSTCKRCVLNMDHHCPWIGNCVGFHNRKFFLLFLFYVNITVIQGIILVSLRLIPAINYIIYSDWTIIYTDIRIIPQLLTQSIRFIINFIFGFMIGNFFKFHIDLVSENRTTIDTLDLKRNNQTPESTPSPYDMGFEKNFKQVMGKNKVLWFFPMYGESGRPDGDGVHWEKSNQQVQLSDQNNSHKTNTNQMDKKETK